MNWIPNGEVIIGRQVPSWDVKFMQRQGLIPGGSKLLYFYSDALLFNRNDGNGITGENVFSYWYDRNGETFLSQSIRYEDIDDISVAYAKSTNENTVITINPKNGSSFILYASSAKGKDRLFVQAIRNRLERQ
jgi:hypothetical protein